MSRLGCFIKAQKTLLGLIVPMVACRSPRLPEKGCDIMLPVCIMIKQHSKETAHWMSTKQAHLYTARQCYIVSHLGSNAYAPWMFVIQQQPFRPEPGVIWVVTLCCHVCRVAHHVQWNHIQQGMTGCMKTISERQAGVLDTLACCPWDPDVCSLKKSRHGHFHFVERMALIRFDWGH